MSKSKIGLYLLGMGSLFLMSCNETDSPSSSLDNGSSQANVICASDNPEYASQVISAGNCDIDYCVDQNSQTSYYIADGKTFQCGSMGSNSSYLNSCAESVVSYCMGSGSNGGSYYSSQGYYGYSSSSARYSSSSVRSSSSTASTVYWGAVAIGQTDDGVAYGLVTNAASSTAAVNQAVTLCRNKGGTNCSSAGAFNNGCAAVAFGSSDNATSVYTSGGETTSEARTAALNYCRSDGSSNCYIDAVQCLDN